MIAIDAINTARLVTLARDRIRAELAVPPVELAYPAPTIQEALVELEARGRRDIVLHLREELGLRLSLRDLSRSHRQAITDGQPDVAEGLADRLATRSRQVARIVTWTTELTKMQPAVGCWAVLGKHLVHQSRTVACGVTVCGLTIHGPTDDAQNPVCLDCFPRGRQ